MSSSIPGSVDMAKVKSYLNTMGTSMSDNALQMMSSVEQYQQVCSFIFSRVDVRDEIGVQSYSHCLSILACVNHRI